MGLCISGGFAFFGNKAPDSNVAEPVIRKAIPSNTQKRRDSNMPTAIQNEGTKYLSRGITELIDRKTLITSSPGDSSLLFVSQNWNPPPPKPAKPAPPPPPVAPPLPFQYLGKKSEDGVVEVYLGSGDKSYVVQKGAVINGLYKVESIAPPIMTMTYLPLNQLQTIQIGSLE
ncbi:hypothetical protein ACO0KY_17870 [Undibacterium sp. Dicai25W]|uniref:hypothetical protein n=1 Tax=Undibacterium sp. Dicai25W TaxID=3413034 RepID=UPI003BEFBD22